MNTHPRNYDQDKVQANCIVRMEEHFMNRIVNLIDRGKLLDADAMHDEFRIDGYDATEWMFMEDLTVYE